MKAENRDLAFGFNYSCTFRAVNKTEKALNIEIAGQSDGVVKYDVYWHSDIADKAEFTSEFFAEKIAGEQDEWRKRPCISADE